MHENRFCYIQRTTYLISQLTSQTLLTVAQNCKSHWFSDMNTTSTYTQMPSAWIFWEFTTTTKHTQPWVWERILLYVTYRLEKIQVPLQGYWRDSLLIHSLQMALGLTYQWPKWHCMIIPWGCSWWDLKPTTHPHPIPPATSWNKGTFTLFYSVI